MLTRLTDIGKAIGFYAIAVVSCAAAALSAPLFGDRTPLVAMFSPLAAVLVMLLVVTRDGYRVEGWRALGVGRAGLDAWPVAVFVPLVILGFSFGCVWLCGVAAFASPLRTVSLPSYVFDVTVSIVVV